MMSPADMVADAGARLAELARDARAWPFAEARRIIERRGAGDDTPVVFETGYGPSGLPHIGTFGEVARTSMVRHAFRVLTGDAVATRLVCFSDDMDGLRKVPDNVPNRELLAAHLDQPLTRVPDPFGEHDSFGRANNARLRAFLDAFGFDYEFLSSTDCYASGRFDAVLLRVLERYDEVMAIMLPSLRAERQATYSPFLPVCPRTGRVLQVPITDRDASAGTISYDDPDTGERVTVPVTGGGAKLQWKVDWAMRWTALSVDYEMAGKDLIDSVRLSGRICTAIGGTPPEGFTYELFLDENGEKISKSRGNGLTIDDWLRYAGQESLSLYMFHAPRKAKRLYFDVIPRHVDDYLSHLSRYREEDAAKRLENPVWHIHSGAPPDDEVPVAFSMLLNLVSASNSEDRAVLWGFIRRYAPGTSPETHPMLDELVGYAIAYFHDFVRPAKTYRPPDDTERAALDALAEALGALPADAEARAIQDVAYDVGRAYFPETLKDGTTGVSRAWFEAFYQVVLGQARGPRFGSFAALYGIAETRALIGRALKGDLAGT